MSQQEYIYHVSRQVKVKVKLWFQRFPCPPPLLHLLRSQHSCEDLMPQSHSLFPFAPLLTHHDSALWSCNPIQLEQEILSIHSYLNQTMCTPLTSSNPAYGQMTVCKFHLIQYHSIAIHLFPTLTDDIHFYHKQQPDFYVKLESQWSLEFWFIIRRGLPFVLCLLEELLAAI